MYFGVQNANLGTFYCPNVGFRNKSFTKMLFYAYEVVGILFLQTIIPTKPQAHVNTYDNCLYQQDKLTSYGTVRNIRIQGFI